VRSPPASCLPIGCVLVCTRRRE